MVHLVLVGPDKFFNIELTQTLVVEAGVGDVATVYLQPEKGVDVKFYRGPASVVSEVLAQFEGTSSSQSLNGEALAEFIRILRTHPRNAIS